MKIRKEAFGYTLFTEQTSGMSGQKAAPFVVELGEEAIYAATTHLSAPEVVHLCITKRCNRNCEFCYVEKDDSEPSADEIKGLIDQLAEIDVFQIAVGGGEPFLREDLFEIADYAAQSEIIFNITTNGSLIDDSLSKRINEQIDHTQLTFTEYDGANLDAASNLSRFGFNLLVTPAIASRFKDLLLLLDSYGPDNILLMDPKPTDLGWYNKNKLGTAEKNAIIKTAKQMQKRMTAKILVDSCFSFELDNTKGCMAARRICYVDYPYVYPCSFLVYEAMRMGDLREDKFINIWEKGTAQDTFRDIGLKAALRECYLLEQYKAKAVI